jgi:hypothetical protein
MEPPIKLFAGATVLKVVRSNLRPARLAQIALGAAVLEPEARRISIAARAWRIRVLQRRDNVRPAFCETTSARFPSERQNGQRLSAYPDVRTVLGRRRCLPGSGCRSSR